jgi:hypothetical protein
MNIKQREILTDFYKGILDYGASGDFVSCYNDAVSMMNELSETDKTLKEYVEIIEDSFEN